MFKLKPIGYTYLPRWMMERSIFLYAALLVTVALLFSEHRMEWYFVLFGTIEVGGFFYFSNLLTKEWSEEHLDSTTFVKRLFITSLVIRVIYVLLSYWFDIKMMGAPFEFQAADSLFYDRVARHGANYLREHGLYGFWNDFRGFVKLGVDDTGYAAYLSFVYFIFNNSILACRFIKSILSALTVIIIYQLAKRNFGEPTARIAGLFCMLMPNLIYYCGLQLKEVEMVFVTVLLIDLSDQMLRSRRFSVWQIVPILLIGGALFTIRTALAVVAILAIIFALILSSEKVMSWPKRIIIGFIAISLLGVSIGNRVQENTKQLIESVKSGSQKGNMEWRANIEGGNKFAGNAGSVVFAPLIFTIPFSTLVEIPKQEGIQTIHGGNFVKNVLSGLVVFSLLILLISGNWRGNAMPLAFMLGYLMVLVFSNFAHSERFHQPVLPFELMFAAYAITLLGKREKRWFNYWLCLMFIANIAWQWFKLAGRNMI